MCVACGRKRVRAVSGTERKRKERVMCLVTRRGPGPSLCCTIRSVLHGERGAMDVLLAASIQLRRVC